MLCNDISLGGKYWTPIGKSADKTFSGTFDGQGHVIRGLYQDVESDFTGLFGAVRGAGASVSHLTVSGNIKLGGRVTYVQELRVMWQGRTVMQRHKSQTVTAKSALR